MEGCLDLSNWPIQHYRRCSPESDGSSEVSRFTKRCDFLQQLEADGTVIVASIDLDSYVGDDSCVSLGLKFTHLVINEKVFFFQLSQRSGLEGFRKLPVVVLCR